MEEVIHGVKVTDPYRWLEDQKSPETRAWIDAQVKYTRSMLDPLPGREALRKRLTELMRTETISMPTARNGAYFYTKRGAAENRYSIYLRRGDKEERLIDPATISKDEMTSVGFRGVSKDGKLLAYSVQEGGADENVIRFFDVEARKDTADTLPKARYLSVLMTPDRTGVYYSDLPAEGPRLYYRRLGQSDAKGEVIFGEGLGPDRALGADLSEDGRWLTITITKGWDESEVYLMDLANQRKVITLLKGVKAKGGATVGGGQVFLMTTLGAPKGRIYRIDPERPQQHFWKLIVPEAKHNLETFSLAGGRLLVEYLANATTQVRMFEADGKYVRDVPLPGLGVGSTSGEWDKDEAFYGFQSFTISPTIFRYSVKDGAASVWAKVSVPLDPAAFDVEQVWYRSKDGTKVPMFVVSKKGAPMDGQRPTILYGYGGFASSSTPFFYPTLAAWVEQGGVFAVANLRGGGEFGEEWHQAGMLEKKQNVFDDFIAAAEWLIQNKVTSPRHALDTAAGRTAACWSERR